MIEADDDAGSAGLRRSVTRAEADLTRAVLAALPQRPHIHLFLACDGSDESIDRCRPTLASLAAQIDPRWTLHPVARRAAGERAALIGRLCRGETDLRSLRRDLPHRLDRIDGLPARLAAEFGDLGGRIEPVPWPADRNFADLAGEAGLIAVLQAGDELACDALAELAIAAGSEPAADFFYSDEIRLNPASGRAEPFLKPQFSPDLLLATNYIGRLWAARTGLAARSGITLRDWLSCGEYDLVLRLTENAAAICHIPRVLCRRGTEPLDAAAAERQALARALDRRGIAGEVMPGEAAGTYRVKRALRPGGRVSVIVATAGVGGLFKTCLDSIRRHAAYPDLEIVAIDDIPAGEAEAKAWLRGRADAAIEVDGPFNWSRYNNRGAAAATGDYLLFLNDDVEAVEPGWLEAMLEHAQRPEIGLVGPRLLYPDGTVQHAGMFLAGPAHGRHAFRRLPRAAPGYFGLAQTVRNVSALTGACLLTRREVFDAVGGFDESHAVINNDLDFCLKVRERGLLCVYTPHATLLHRELASRAALPERYDHAGFVARWRDAFARGDPYHHPSLSRHTDDLAADPEPVEIVHAGRPVFDRDSVRRILAVKLDHIGDCVMAVPAIRRLKRHFPHAEIHVLAGPWSRPIWAAVPEVAGTIALEFFRADAALPHLRFSREELAALRRALAAYRFDLAIDLRHYPETRPLLRHTGARYTAGFNHRGQFPWLDVSLSWDGDRGGVEEPRYLGDFLVALVDAVAAAGETDRSVFPAPARPAPPPAGRPLVCVHPAVSNETRRWPAEHFAALIDRLIEEDGVDVAVIGAAGDRAIADAVLDGVRNRARVTARIGDIALADLPSFLAGCALFVGNNSGPKHIAAALGVPTVGVHSGTVDAREWGPFGPRAVAVWRRVACAPCYLSRAEDCPRRLACLTELRPMDVYPVCRRLLLLGRAHD